MWKENLCYSCISAYPRFLIRFHALWMRVRLIYKALLPHVPVSCLGHACHQHRWEPSVCSRPRMEPKRHLQPVHLRHPGRLLHPGLGECPEQQRPWGQRHDRPLWGMSQGTCGPESLQCLDWLMKAQHWLFAPWFVLRGNFVASFHLGEGVSCRTFVLVNWQCTKHLWEGSFLPKSTGQEAPEDLESIWGRTEGIKGFKQEWQSMQFENSLEGPAGHQDVEQRGQWPLISVWGKEWRGHLFIASEDTPLDLNTFLTS